MLYPHNPVISEISSKSELSWCRLDVLWRGYQDNLSDVTKRCFAQSVKLHCRDGGVRKGHFANEAVQFDM